ncbi:hypothetical protein JCM18237_14950 [Halorubrum luteum]
MGSGNGSAVGCRWDEHEQPHGTRDHYHPLPAASTAAAVLPWVNERLGTSRLLPVFGVGPDRAVRRVRLTNGVTSVSVVDDRFLGSTFFVVAVFAVFVVARLAGALAVRIEYSTHPI